MEAPNQSKAIPESYTRFASTVYFPLLIKKLFNYPPKNSGI